MGPRTKESEARDQGIRGLVPLAFRLLLVLYGIIQDFAAWPYLKLEIVGIGIVQNSGKRCVRIGKMSKVKF